MIFGDEETLKSLLGLLNSKVVQFYLNVLNPTLSMQNSDLEKVPVASAVSGPHIVAMVSENICSSQFDWDASETSWDFKRNSLV